MFSWWLRPAPTIGEEELERGLKALVYDGVFAQAMLVLTTGAFLVGLALLLGASNAVIGLLAAVGPVMQTVQLPATYLVEWLRARRFLTVVGFAASRFALVGIAALPLLVARETALVLLVALLACHFGFAAVAGCAFNSWIRDFIPLERMERFFARRLALATLAGAGVSFLGGVGIDLYKANVSDESVAYSLVFGIGACAGLISVVCLSHVPEPRMPQAGRLALRSLLAEPVRDRNFRNLLIFLAWWSFAVNFAAPFFAVYLLKNLGLSMTWVLVLSVLSQLCNVMFYGIWGRLAERFSNKSVLVFAVPMFFFTFVLWPFTTLPDPHFLTFPILVAIHVVAGVAAAGVALCAGNLALKSAPYGKAGSYLAVNALISGAAATLAPILAGFAADAFEPYQLRVSLTFLEFREGLTQVEFPTVDFKGMEFVFLIAFVFGLYSLHRLLAVKEEGEVEERVLRQAFLAETRRMVREISTVAGVRQFILFPSVFLFNRNKH